MEAEQQCTTVAPAPAVSEVLGNSDLLRQILRRLDLPTDLVRSALVSKQWLGAASNPAFLRDFRARSPPPLLGFLAVFGDWPSDEDAVSASSDEAIGPCDELIEGGEDAPGEVTLYDYENVVRFVPLPHLPAELAGAARRVAAAFSDAETPDIVRDCRNGHVLVIPKRRYGTYAVRSPMVDVAQAQQPAPPLSVDVDLINEPDNYFAEFVLVRDNQPGGDALSCFNSLQINYTASSNGVIDVKLQVHVLQDGAWVTHTSPLLQVPKPLNIYEFAYNLVVGSNLCMVTIFGYIVVLDLVAASFSLVKLPDSVSCGEWDVQDHRLAHADDMGLCLVHVKGFELRILHLRMEDAGGVWEWVLVDTVYLPDVFGDLLGKPLCEFMVVEICAVGNNADFVFLTVEDNDGVYLLDVKMRTVKKVLQTSPENDGYLSRIFPFVMPWPPVFPSLKEGGHGN